MFYRTTGEHYRDVMTEKHSKNFVLLDADLSYNLSSCHSERSEESVTQSGRTQILRFAQNDNDVL